MPQTRSARDHLPGSSQVRWVPGAPHRADDPTRGTKQRVHACWRWGQTLAL